MEGGRMGGMEGTEGCEEEDLTGVKHCEIATQNVINCTLQLSRCEGLLGLSSLAEKVEGKIHVEFSTLLQSLLNEKDFLVVMCINRPKNRNKVANY